MLPWQVIARWSFCGFLALMSIMEIVEDRDGMHQEFDQWSDKEFEKRKKKEDAQWEKEEKEFFDEILDAPAMLKKAKQLRIKEEKKARANRSKAGEEEEEQILRTIKELYKELQQQVAEEAAAAAEEEEEEVQVEAETVAA